MRAWIVFISLLALLITGCFKEDEPMPPSSIKTTTIEMTQDYLYQSYFDLGSGEVVSVNEKNVWDLGFSCGDSSWQIILNTSGFMLAANTGIKDFELVSDTTGLNWRFDKSDGNPDSTAIGKWLSINGGDTIYSGHVYIIHRGYDHLGNFRGLRKIVFQKADLLAYTFRYANLDGSNMHEFIIHKNDDLNYTFFSFDGEGEELFLEPPRNSWDILFTQYTTLLYTNEGDPYPYLLTGVLLNYGEVEVATDTITPFQDINLDLALNMQYSNKLDAIGYNWKYLEGDINTGNFIYKVNTHWNYIIRNRNGVYFKLHFTRFYNDEGEKGYPTFEFKSL